MTFAVELPGEASPLTPDLVHRVLISATSSEQQRIQTATQQLQAWETQRGFFTLLQTAYLDISLPLEARHLAIIQLKNGIDKYWRKTAKNAIAVSEKVHIRSRLLEGGITQEEKNLALQNALVVSKVVRIDYPVEWPEALPNLIKILRDSRHSNRLYLQRGLLTLLQLVKELASARLRASQTKFSLITQELVFLISEIYLENVNRWISSIKEQVESGKKDEEQDKEKEKEELMESSLLAIKILRRLAVDGYEYPNHSPDAQKLWEYSQIQFGELLKLISIPSPLAVANSSKIMIMVEEHLLQLSKLHLTMANQHPAAFSLLPNSLDLVRAYWGLVTNFGESLGSETYDISVIDLHPNRMKDDPSSFTEKLCLKGLNIMRACIKMVFNPLQSFKYKSAEVKVEQKKAIELIRTELLTDLLVQQIANLILTRFFILRQIDIQAWEEDQEEWELREEGGGWEFDIRLCSERLFTDVVINYKHLLLNPLLSYFGSVTGAGAGQISCSSIVTKDAVYTAMGLSAPIVYDSFDFDSFLGSILVNDVQQTGPGCKVLRRRIAILIGQWITIKVSLESRIIVYEIFQHLLKAEDKINDRVVHMTAARRFKCIVDDFSFHVEHFIPYAPGILGRIMNLVQEVEVIESKIVILDTVRSIANRLENHIVPFADHIISMLASLWEASINEYVLKQSIFAIFSTIVTSLRQASDRYYPLILPLIANSISSSSEAKVYLLEDALDLWTHVLETSSSNVSPELSSLIDAIFPLLELGSNELRNVLHILDTYCILAPQHMLSDTRRFRIISCLTTLLGVSKRDLAGLVTTIIENFIRAAEKIGGAHGVTLITQDLHNSGYLLQIFAGLRDAWEAHQTIGPNKRYPELDDVVETDYFTVLARLAVADPNIFANILSSLGPFDEVWSWLSNEWFRQFDCITNIERRKLSCLALTRMLELPPPTLNLILANLQDYFTIWTQTIGEMIGGSVDLSDCLIWKPSDDVCDGENMDTVRRREWAMADIVHRVTLWDFVKEKLAQTVEKLGGETRFAEEWLVNVEEAVLKGYRTLGTNWQQQ